MGTPDPADPGCVFCRIAAGSADAEVVHRGADTVAFLDRRPLFAGHTLLCPRAHHVTLPELPRRLVEPLFADAQLLCRAVTRAMDAPGTFVAMNNTVSQSVAHLHVHVVPRRPKDGLRGFFWPRKRLGEQEMAAAAAKIRTALDELVA